MKIEGIRSTRNTDPFKPQTDEEEEAAVFTRESITREVGITDCGHSLNT